MSFHVSFYSATVERTAVASRPSSPGTGHSGHGRAPILALERGGSPSRYPLPCPLPTPAPSPLSLPPPPNLFKTLATGPPPARRHWSLPVRLACRRCGAHTVASSASPRPRAWPQIWPGACTLSAAATATMEDGDRTGWPSSRFWRRWRPASSSTPSPTSRAGRQPRSSALARSIQEWLIPSRHVCLVGGRWTEEESKRTPAPPGNLSCFPLMLACVGDLQVFRQIELRSNTSARSLMSVRAPQKILFVCRYSLQSLPCFSPNLINGRRLRDASVALKTNS
jgi:hypothetical protein